MLWSVRPTIGSDEEQWQLETWRWLLDNLGGTETFRTHPIRLPSHADFPKSGLSGHAHVAFVFHQVAEAVGVDPASFELVAQEDRIDPKLGPLAMVENAPAAPAGTYRLDGNAHLITYDPATARDLEALIATLVHEICHPILLGIATPPPGGDEAEEFATDLATVFFGFGIFGGNCAFRFDQFRDDATGTQGWSVSRQGYLSQNEWGYALALKTILCKDDPSRFEKCLADGLAINFRKNHRYLTKNSGILEQLR